MPCVGWGHLGDEFGVKDDDDHKCQTVEGVDSMTMFPIAVKFSNTANMEALHCLQ